MNDQQKRIREAVSKATTFALGSGPSPSERASRPVTKATDSKARRDDSGEK